MPAPAFSPELDPVEGGWRAIAEGPPRARIDATVMKIPPEPARSLVVEAVEGPGIELHRAAWADLVSRCLEPNVFMEPAFAIPAALHLAAHRGLLFILVWDLHEAGPRDLVAVCPIVRPGWLFRRTARVWFHDLIALGAPLLDRVRGAAALEAILASLDDHLPGCKALHMNAVPAEGPTADVLRRLGAATGRAVVVLDVHRRAFLGEPVGLSETRTGPLDVALSRRKAKDLGRQRRRLEEGGPLRYECARGGEELRSAVERFLALEASGWKGRAGTALLGAPARSAFARTMTRLLAREGKCRIDSLMSGDAPLAMGVVLSSRGRDFFWKMAYDERHAARSPGVQFVLELTRAQTEAGRAVPTDSCAAPDHPMIDRLWPDRLAVADMMIAVAPGPSLGFDAQVRRERRWRRGKAVLKAALEGARKRVRAVMKSAGSGRPRPG